MAVGLVVVVDDPTEGLVGVGATHDPSAFALLLDVEARQRRRGFAGQTAEIVGGLVLGTKDGGRALQHEGGVLHASPIADGKLALVGFAGAVDNQRAREVVPVAFDVFTQIVDVPDEGARTADLALVGVPEVEIDG